MTKHEISLGVEERLQALCFDKSNEEDPTERLDGIHALAQGFHREKVGKLLGTDAAPTHYTLNTSPTAPYTVHTPPTFLLTYLGKVSKIKH